MATAPSGAPEGPAPAFGLPPEQEATLALANPFGRTELLSDAVQIHGGAGYVWEMEVNRIYRFTKLLEIGAGTSEVRRMVIAEELLST